MMVYQKPQNGRDVTEVLRYSLKDSDHATKVHADLSTSNVGQDFGRKTQKFRYAAHAIVGCGFSGRDRHQYSLVTISDCPLRHWFNTAYDPLAHVLLAIEKALSSIASRPLK